METLKKLKRNAFFVAIVYLIIGLIMLLNPTFVRDAVNYIMGVIAILYGLIYSINIYQKKDTELYGKFDLLGGILCISFGLFLIVNPDILISLIPFSGGVIIFMDAIVFIRHSISLKKVGYQKWWINLIISFIFLGFSIYIIVNAKEITDLLIRIIGLFLIIDALDDVIVTMLLSRKLKETVKDLKVIESKVEESNIIENKD